MKRPKLVRLNGKLYPASLLSKPVHRDLDLDFYNLAFAAINQIKKQKKAMQQTACD